MHRQTQPQQRELRNTKLPRELTRLGATPLILVGVTAAVLAWTQQGLAAPAGTPTAPTMLNEARCTLLPIPLRAPLSRREAPAQPNTLSDLSLNWSGYAAATRLAAPQKGAVSFVAGSWTIPTLAFSGSARTFSACWVGMDGTTVEQIGTEQDWTPGGQVNYVWFEMYPHSAYLISGFPIAPGEQFGAGVAYLGNGTFRLSITNFTQNTAFTLPTRYTRMLRAQRSSAEWVVEAPYLGRLLPLANFGTVEFTGCSARLNGTLGPIDHAFWQAEAIAMATLSGVPKAIPSPLSDSGADSSASSAFSVTWSHR